MKEKKFLVTVQSDDDRTRWIKKDEDIAIQIKMVASDIVEAATEGVVPRVFVLNHPSDGHLLNLLRAIVGGDPASVKDDVKMFRAIEDARKILGYEK